MKKETFVTKAQLEEIVKEYPTPFHLYDEAGIRKNAQAVKEAFAWNPGFREYFAVKATPNPYILNILKDYDCGCQKTHFRDETHWLHGEIAACDEKSVIEKSWAEQREYVYRAAELLDVDLSETLAVQMPDITNMQPVDRQPHAEISYQLFDRTDYERFREEYLRLQCEWSHWDFTKVGLPDYRGGIFEPQVTGAWQDGDTTVFRMTFDDEIRLFAGLPEIWLIERADFAELRWFGKKPNRLPEAFWMRFPQLVDRLQMLKMGAWIDAAQVLDAKNMHSVWSVRNETYEIETLDAPLAAPYGRNLLRRRNPTDTQNLFFNLYNNVWNTNFPMWFADDAKFRFAVHKR